MANFSGVLIFLTFLAPFEGYSSKTWADVKGIEASQAYFQADTVRTFAGTISNFQSGTNFLLNFRPRFNQGEAIKGIELKLNWASQDNDTFVKLGKNIKF